MTHTPFISFVFTCPNSWYLSKRSEKNPSRHSSQDVFYWRQIDDIQLRPFNWSGSFHNTQRAMQQKTCLIPIVPIERLSIPCQQLPWPPLRCVFFEKGAWMVSLSNNVRSVFFLSHSAVNLNMSALQSAGIFQVSKGTYTLPKKQNGPDHKRKTYGPGISGSSTIIRGISILSQWLHHFRCPNNKCFQQFWSSFSVLRGGPLPVVDGGEIAPISRVFFTRVKANCKAIDRSSN